eukprot:4724127-Alexandrium_andersonii.AAC.1
MSGPLVGEDAAAAATCDAIVRSIPAAVPGIFFLSGGVVGTDVEAPEASSILCKIQQRMDD